MTWALVDSKGQQAYSQYRVVQSNGNATAYCPKTVYSTPSPPASPVGAIAGGVVGGVVGLLLLLGALLAYMRRRRIGDDEFEERGGSEEPEMALTDGAAGVRRAGTFNLHNVEFTDTEVSRAALESPPTYSGPPPTKRHHFFSSSRGSRATSTTLSDVGGSRRISTAAQSIAEEGEVTRGEEAQVTAQGGETERETLSNPGGEGTHPVVA